MVGSGVTKELFTKSIRLRTLSYRCHRRFHVTLENIFSEENKGRCQKEFQKQPQWNSKIKTKAARTSSVLIPLCRVKGKPSVLFSVRSHHMPNHRGEVSFPGGMTDKSDEGPFHTAIREAQEEIGMDPGVIDIWGQMASVPTTAKKGNMATPVIAYCGEVDVKSLKLCDREVEAVFTRTIESLCKPGNARQTTFRGYRGGTLTTPGYTLPVFIGGKHKIWGLSAIFLHMALTVIAPGLYTFKLKHPRLHDDAKGKKAS